MKAGHRNILAKVLISALLVATATEPAVAIRPRPANSIPTQTQVAWILVGIAAIGAAIGIGIYFAVRPHGQRITGCAGSGPNGPQLVSESDQQIYALDGDLAGIQAGERIRVSGKKEKKTAGAPRKFLVEKTAKNLGSCKVQPATP